MATGKVAALFSAVLHAVVPLRSRLTSELNALLTLLTVVPVTPKGSQRVQVPYSRLLDDESLVTPTIISSGCGPLGHIRVDEVLRKVPTSAKKTGEVEEAGGVIIVEYTGANDEKSEKKVSGSHPPGNTSLSPLILGTEH